MSRKTFYWMLFSMSIFGMAGDCDDLMTFLLWHMFWGVVMVYSGRKLEC